MKLLVIIAAIALSFQGFAQSEGALIKDMSDLEFMEGTWKGEGWIIGRGGHKKTFHQTEIIKSKVNGHVLTIDGLGYAIEDSLISDRIIHDVVGIISINPESGNATMFSILENQGRSEVDLFMLEGGKTFQWSFKNPHTDSVVRFTEDLSNENQWIGIGEVYTPQNRWHKFFEMSLFKE